MTETKPCQRPECQGVVSRPPLTPSGYARQRFCSTRCAALWRYAHGAKPPQTTHAQRVEGGRKAGLLSGETRRRQAAARIAAQLEPFITPDMTEPLSPRALARWKALVARAWSSGHTAGRSSVRIGRAA